MEDRDDITAETITKQISPNFDDLNSPETIINHFEELKKETYSDDLKTVLDTQAKLRELKAAEVRFSEPILKQSDNAVIFPHTINVIQGQAGVHKSRLAESICAAFLKLDNCPNELLGFSRNHTGKPHTVVYVDTERNLHEQLPYALQCIQVKAGYTRSAHPSNFEYISLLQISRNKRFTVLSEYLQHLKKKTSNPLFIVLDVSTDCIEDFNKTDKSMELIDLMNVTINRHDAVFLCLIHENPKSDKARGHFGTELMNKASTVMQVGFEKDSNQNDTDLIRVKYLKCRSTARHTAFYLKYDETAKGLILAQGNDVTTAVNNRKRKASNEDVIDLLEMYLGDGSVLPRTNLLDRLCRALNASQRIIESRLLEIIKTESEILNSEGQICKLWKETKEKATYYQLANVQLF